MHTLFHTIIYRTAQNHGCKCSEAQVDRFINQMIQEDRISVDMDNGLCLNLAWRTWLGEFQKWLKDQLSVKYKLLDNDTDETFKIVCERLEEAQLVWDSMVFLRNRYSVVSGRPY